MTEEEAKTKWCPHAIASHTNPRAITGWDGKGGTLAEPRYVFNCIGSACMAWRWSMEPNPAYVEQTNVWPDTRQPQQKQPMLPGKKRGYCGLAGCP